MSDDQLAEDRYQAVRLAERLEAENIRLGRVLDEIRTLVEEIQAADAPYSEDGKQVARYITVLLRKAR